MYHCWKTKFWPKKNLSLSAGKLSLEKKVCAFELCLVLIQKYTKSFGGEKSCSMLTIFSHQKSSIFLVLILDAVQIRRNFFPLGHPPYAKKVKEIAYILTCYQALLEAQLFFLFIYVIKEKRKTIVDTFFICIFTHFIQLVLYLYMAKFTRDHKNISLNQKHITQQWWNNFKRTKRFTKSKG